MKYSVWYWDKIHKDWASDSDTDTDDLKLARQFLYEHSNGYITDENGEVIEIYNPPL